MNFIAAVRMECYKSINRASTKLLGLFVALPLFYGIGYIRHSQAIKVEGTFSAVSFGSFCWSLLGLTGLTNILFIILVSNYFGKEKEEGQIKLVLLENCNRKKVVLAKYISVLFLVLLSYILMYFASIAVYYSCIAGPEHGSMFIDGIEDLLISLPVDFLYLVQLIMIVSVEVLLCMYYKSSFSLLLGVVLSMVTIGLQYVPFIQFADPIYVVDLFNSSKISATGVFIYGIVYLCLSFILIIFATKKFQRIEIK